ncbi:MAG: hypothetical protein MUC89_20065 [Acetobacteraceae bacterium]|jgi:hypothetical protein|nr:hypothetical protein [Acetobacteraceae bacterium]
MIAAAAAGASAAAALAALLRQGDALLLPWGEVGTGAPVAVHTTGGAPSYWLVPLVVAARVIGFARIGPGGEVAAIGITCRTPDRVEDCPRLVTDLSSDEALARARLDPGETALPPLYVHDGPPGREAWLVRTERAGRPHRWIFVTAGGAHARPAGMPHGTDPARE